MLEEINQLLLIRLAMLIMVTILPRQIASPNTLARFVRVTIILEISLVDPSSKNHGMWVLINLCHRSLAIMIVIDHQLVNIRLGKRKLDSNFLKGYVKEVIKLTFYLIWMKPQNYWKILLIFSNKFQLVTINFLLTHH
jgi:hypothetical protein